MICALPLNLMYRFFSKPYVLMLHAVLFSLFQYASTIVTYMIVLLQFDQSDKSQNACSRNVTNWVTGSLELVCVCHVTYETAQFIIIIIIIIIIIVTNTITITMRTSACCKWYMVLSQRSSMCVTEQAGWGKSKNLDNLTNCRGQWPAL
jgi:hypothetical protein